MEVSTRSIVPGDRGEVKENFGGSAPVASFLRYNALRNWNLRLCAEIPGKESPLMPRRTIFLNCLLLCLFASLPSLWAQMPPTQKDSLIPGQNVPGKAGCSTTVASSCAE